MWLTWRAAMERALYGEDGFYLRERPSGHFRTSVGASPASPRPSCARSIAGGRRARPPAAARPRRHRRRRGRAGRPTCSRRATPRSRARLRIIGVDLAPRPAGLPEEIAWRLAVPGLDHRAGDRQRVARQRPARHRRADRRRTPARHGQRPRPATSGSGTGRRRGPTAWLDRWWPLRGLGERAEIGRPRDAAWASVIERLAGGLAIAIDYAHARGRPPAVRHADRLPRRPIVSPCRTAPATSPRTSPSTPAPTAGRARRRVTTLLTTQREALRALGLRGTRSSRRSDLATSGD